MSILEQLRDWKPISVGQPAPQLSLTADEGTWVRLSDYRGRQHVVLIFFRSINSDRIDEWLRSVEAVRARLESLDATVFGVSTYRADKLREHRRRLGLGFRLLYDPLAMDARRFRCSGRLRPYCKNTVVVIDKDGAIDYSRRGLIEPTEIVAAIAAREGQPLPTSAAPAEVRFLPPDDVIRLLAQDPKLRVVDVRTLSEFEADHVPDSVHIPVDELPARYAELGQTDKIVFICQAGGRAAAAAEFVSSIGGRELYVAEGGMTAWSGARVTGGEQHR